VISKTRLADTDIDHHQPSQRRETSCIETGAPSAAMTGLIPGLLILVGIASATPEAATWRRQTLLGQNTEFLFRYVATSDYPGSYYTYPRTLRLEKVRKVDLTIVESFVLRDVTYSHPDKLAWREESGPVDSLDLPRYLKAKPCCPRFRRRPDRDRLRRGLGSVRRWQYSARNSARAGAPVSHA